MSCSHPATPKPHLSPLGSRWQEILVVFSAMQCQALRKSLQEEEEEQEEMPYVSIYRNLLIRCQKVLRHSMIQHPRVNRNATVDS